MICLADNDLILKLACCDLLPQATDALGAAPSDVFVLGSAVHKLLSPKRPGKGKVKPAEPEYPRLQTFFAAVRVIEAAPPPDEQQAFNDVIGIDPGEAVLFSATAAYPDCILATGDKRSLVALCGAGGEICERVRVRLTGRVVCLEQAMLRVIDALGFTDVLARVVPGRHCDMVIRSVFGSGLYATEEHVREGLQSYVQDLRRQTACLLVH